MRSQGNRKRNRELNTLKCCGIIYTYVPPTPGFISPSSWKVVALQTDTQTQRFCCLQWQPQVQNLKWRHLFQGLGGFFSQRTLHSAKLFFSIIFLDNVSIPIVLEHYVWTEPLLVGLFREQFKLSFFPLRDNLQKAALLSARPWD